MQQVSLIGPPGSGKTNLFTDISQCAQMGFHGFDSEMDLAIQIVDGEHRKFERYHRYQTPESTTLGRPATFRLSYRVPGSAGSDRETLEFQVRDAAGEALFPPSDTRPEGDDSAAPMADEISQQKDWFDNGVGVVMVQAVWRAHNRAGLQELLDRYDDFIGLSADRMSEYKNLKRVVIVINMFDLLLLRYGPTALDIASNDAQVLRILQSFLRNVTDTIRDFTPENASGEKLDVRFIATSSFGFLPEIGCANIDPSNSIFDLKEGKFPHHFETRRYPYMIADPFVFAATGKSNPFLFTLDDVLGASS